MRYSYKLSDAVHILCYLEIYKGKDLSSKAIAKSIESNPSIVRQFMSDLRKAGLLETRKGTADPSLTKKPADISLLQIYQAISMDHDLLHIDPKTNPECIVGGNIQNTLNHYYNEIQLSTFTKMSEISLQNIIDDILERQREKKK